MAIHYTMKAEGDLLVVESSGFDENLEEVEQYGLSIINACKAGNYLGVLCDESQLEYRLGTFDTFKSAEFIAEQAPRVGRVAIISNEKNIVDARFWETVAVNRGLMVRVFKNTQEARQWLGE